MDAAELIDAPKAEDVNSGFRSCPTKLLLKTYGPPRGDKSTVCQGPTNRVWKSFMITRTVPVFGRVTGHRVAVESLARIGARIQAKEPLLARRLGHAGMLCCRKVRGGSAWSNHSFGMAIDITIDGRVDPRGDGKIQAGLLTLYRFFRAEGWWWGVEFRIEDGMHFELAEHTVREKVLGLPVVVANGG